MIYLDHHATTPLLPEAFEAMRPYLTEAFGNPSSAHASGRQARRALDDARERIAELLDAHPDEVIFTSGATEANNLAVFGLAGDSPAPILASRIEHPCVTGPLEELAARGYPVTWLPADSGGLVGAPEIAAACQRQPDLRLVCLMLVNHETGACQEYALTTLKNFPSILIHTDAAQAVGKRPVSFRQLSVATLTASAHKFGGPKGVGLLMLKRGVKLRPLLHGGHQQQGRRPGTEPVALAVGMAKALEVSLSRVAEAAAEVGQLRRLFVDRLRELAAPCAVNGPDWDSPQSSALPNNGSPYVVNLSFPGCRADLLLMKLDLAGVACSTGSACSSGSLRPSSVLRAMALPDDRLLSALRFSFSPTQSRTEVLEAAARISMAVNDLRRSDNESAY